MILPMDYAEFQEHIDALDGVATRVGDITTVHGNYVGRECVVATYDHATGMADLRWV